MYREHFASDPNKYSSGIYTVKPIEGFSQIRFVEYAALESEQAKVAKLEAKVKELKKGGKCE